MAETIWWCEEHGANGDGPLGDGPKPQALHPCCLVAMLAACEDVDLAKPCHMVEVEICAVGAKRSPAEVRAAVVPLLDYEAAVRKAEEWEHASHLRGGGVLRIHAIVDAALGIGEPTEGSE